MSNFYLLSECEGKMRKRLLGMLFVVLAVCCLAPIAAWATDGNTGNAESTSATSSDTVADPSTIWDWEGLINNKTANVGRIWTDKSVTTDSMTNNNITVTKADGSAFLTALTALSSTSNLSSTQTTPLDIVLVLDTSSSMTQSISTSTGTTTRIEALKEAANSFVDVIADKNKDVSDEAKQHRVAVVSFNAEATTNQGMTVCAGDKATEIKSAITDLTTSQGTRSDYGLQQAQSVLTDSKRDGAKQVVVFFTDGIPTESGADNFDPAIASPAVTAAGQMKDAGKGATVYTIGIHNEAEPSDDPEADNTHDLNKFLHAVSSNYPNATYAKDGSYYVWNFGDRAHKADETDADFYKSATTADELEKIFEDISQEIIKNAGYPTHTTDDAESTSGYITFNDQLGDYMQVSDLSTLIYNATTYTCDPESKTTEETTDGSIDTYHFSGTVNSGISKGELSGIIIKVTRSKDVATGDKVEVKIPATLIPLRQFDVDLDKDTMSVTEKTPITVFYSSGLKPEVADLMVNPDDDMTAYIAANTDKDTGKVNFYANKWTGKSTGEEHLGDVTAQFNPSKDNSYYYFTQDTPIFEDENCTERATEIVDGETYYYQHAYYVQGEDGKTAKKRIEKPTFPGSAATAFEGAIGTDEQGYAYFKAGTARLAYINQLKNEKIYNYTGTAKDVLNPKWNSETSVAKATTVTSYLGNNGKLSLDKPATLEISKTLADDYSQAQYGDTEFIFNISIPNAAGKTFSTKLVTGDESTAGELSFDEDGNATCKLKHGQILQVLGLSAGWKYKVSEPEDDLPAGFKQVAAEGSEGEFEADETSEAAFTNVYSPEPAKSSVTDSVEVTKNLTGRDLTQGEFKFELLDADGNTVATGTNDSNGKVVLDSVEYTQIGEYNYTLHEVNGGQTIDNVTYDNTNYQVQVRVSDNGKGKLVAETQIPETLSELSFTNTYTEPIPDPEPSPDDESDDIDDGDDEESDDAEEAASESAKTGDDLASLALAVAVVALAAGSVALMARRKQN